MSGFSRFGDYVLLRKLDEGGLGESYRAGRLDGGGTLSDTLSDVVMLRLFSGAGLDADRLVGNLRSSPKVGAGPGLPRLQAAGAQAGICFTAYEYVAGKDLATLTRRANDGFSTLAMEHALLVAERVAKGLAWLHREHGAAHGFLVPQLLHISEEGETKLHGFEVGPALAAHVARGVIDPAFRSYLSPEVLGGSEPGPQDDVFALGAVLLELLTGTPPGAEEGVSARLQRARLVESERPIPTALQRLIADSLAPPAARPADAKAWHQQLGAWMAESGMRATNFDLAFFVQELFRDELKRETVERDDERRRLSTPAAPVAEPSGSDVAVAMPVPEPAPAAAEPPASPSGRGRMMMPLVAAVVVFGLAAWFLIPRFFAQGSGPTTEMAEASAALGTDSPAPTASAGTVVASPWEGTLGTEEAGTSGEGTSGEADGEGDQAEGDGSARVTSLAAASEDLEKLIQDRAAALEERLASEYDQEIATMRAQLETARRVEAEARAALTAVSDPAPASVAPVVGADGASVGLGAAESALPTIEEVVGDVAGPAIPPPATGASNRAGGDQAQVAEETSPAPSEPAAPVTDSETEDPKTPDRTTRDPLAGEPPEQEPAIRVPKAVPPRLVQPPTARYPAAARNARRAATVIVKILVGRDGRVLDAGMVSEKMVGYGFDQAAINAARNAVYKPATVGGKPVEQWTTLVIRFEP